MVGYDNRARIYDPTAGRFNVIDLINDPRSLHKYLYSDNNPINLADPLGQASYPYTSTNGMAAHFLFSAFVMARGFTANPAAPLKELLPEELSLVGVGLAPDVLDKRNKTYFELKPVTHIASGGLQGKDSLQMNIYSAVLSPLGYSRGDSTAIAGEFATPIGFIVGDRGEVFLVTLYPQNDPMEPSGLDGSGLILYSLKQVPIPDRFSVPKKVPQPVNRPFQILKPQERFNVPIEVHYPSATVIGWSAVGLAVAGGTTVVTANNKLRPLIDTGISILLGVLA